MTNAAKHTPTPWQAMGIYILAGHPAANIAVMDNVHLFGTEQSEANAAFIVKAVNCHEQLVETLKQIAHANTEYQPDITLTFEDLQEIAKAALAAVEVA